ncbi:AMMECR1 domain-containing protein [Lipomyces oligophaga]|uniref:AMMECR1 domain-containing protein n=1 Tax=Lipomyces oligophaga TaxID=45792 RepID=UPI0034CFA681
MASKAQCALCFDVLAAEFEDRDPHSLGDFERALARTCDSPSESIDTSSESDGSVSMTRNYASPIAQSEKYPLFVTWNTVTSHGSHRLRGCIGTFQAQPLEHGLKSYASTAAFYDSRFPPITAPELPSLECGVSLLTNFEDAADALDWEWGVHGIRISFSVSGHRYSATYLPDVAPEHFKTKQETIESLVLKAGYRGRTDWSKLEISLVRYQSSKEYLKYPEYLKIMANV